MINVAIAGCGSITKYRHAPEYAANNDVQIMGFYDHFKERAQQMVAEYGGRIYESFEEILADPSVQAVSICTANSFHAEMTQQALLAGKHVLCEKPMATTVEEAEKMVRVADQTGKFLMIGHNQRLVPAHQLAKKLLDSGEIGTPLTFKTIFSHPGPEAWGVDHSKGTWFFKKSAAGFGSLADLGVHKVDLIRWLLGDEITEVTTVMATLDKKDENGNFIEVDDNSMSILRTKSNILGTLTTGWTNYGEEDNSTIIYCTKGVLEIFTDPKYSVKVTRNNGEKAYYQTGAIQTNTNQTKSGVIDLFVSSLKNNTYPEISGKDALQVMRIIEAMDKSSKERRTVQVQQD